MNQATIATPVGPHEAPPKDYDFTKPDGHQLVLGFVANRTIIDGHRAPLTNKECKILAALVVNKGTVVTKEMLLDVLYVGKTVEPKFKIIDVFVCKMRKKLAPHFDSHLQTLWGRGYSWVEDVVENLGVPAHVRAHLDDLGLPPPDTIHWTTKNKKTIVAAIERQEASANMLCRWYRLLPTELERWATQIQKFGTTELLKTRVQQRHRL